jgi:hypothetical protein
MAGEFVQRLALGILLPPGDAGEGRRAGDAALPHLRDGEHDLRLVEHVHQRLDVFGKIVLVLEDMALAELPDRRGVGEQVRDRLRIGVVEAGAIGGEEFLDVGLGLAHSGSSS